jgi:hypothetical protein
MATELRAKQAEYLHFQKFLGFVTSPHCMWSIT